MFLVVIVNASHRQPKTSTFLSFDIKKKVKHHNHDNASQTTLRPPAISTNEEEMEFTLRVRQFNFVDLGVNHVCVNKRHFKSKLCL